MGRTLQEVTGEAIVLSSVAATASSSRTPNRLLPLREGDVIVLYGEARTLRPVDAG